MVRAGTAAVDEATGAAWGHFVADTEALLGVREDGTVTVLRTDALSFECDTAWDARAVVPGDAVDWR